MYRLKSIFKNRLGEIRLIWLLLFAAFLYGLSMYGVSALYWSIYHKMMGIWGVTSANISRAPGIVQFLYRFSALIAVLIQNGCLLLSARWLAAVSDMNTPWSKRGFWQGILLGTAGVVLIWAFCMALGCVRLGASLKCPSFSINTAAIMLTSLISAAGEGYFLYGIFKRVLMKRLSFWLALSSIALFNMCIALLNGNSFFMSLLNAALMATTCALLAEDGRISQMIGFRMAWVYMDQGILGFAGSQAALYETYPVNLYWLNGGNGGLNASLLSCLLLAGMSATLLYIRRYAHHEKGDK